jgi:hypothetical protein
VINAVSFLEKEERLEVEKPGFSTFLNVTLDTIAKRKAIEWLLK